MHQAPHPADADAQPARNVEPCLGVHALLSPALSLSPRVSKDGQCHHQQRVQCHHPRQHADAGGRVASKVRERLRTSCGRQSPNACAYEEPLTGGAPRRRERRQPPPRAPSATRSPARHAADQVPSGRDAASPLPLQRPHDGLSTPATSGGPARYQHHPGR